MENSIHWVAWADVREVLESICVSLRSLLDFTLTLLFHICFSLTQTSRFALWKQVCSSAKILGRAQHTFCSSWRQDQQTLLNQQNRTFMCFFLLTFFSKNGAKHFVRCLLSVCLTSWKWMMCHFLHLNRFIFVWQWRFCTFLCTLM